MEEVDRGVSRDIICSASPHDDVSPVNELVETGDLGNLGDTPNGQEPVHCAKDTGSEASESDREEEGRAVGRPRRDHTAARYKRLQDDDFLYSFSDEECDDGDDSHLTGGRRGKGRNRGGFGHPPQKLLGGMTPVDPVLRTQRLTAEQAKAIENLSSQEFEDSLIKLYASLQIYVGKLPKVDGNKLDLKTFIIAVANRGGFYMVDELKSWKAIAKTDLKIPLTTSIGNHMKMTYRKWLLPYENHVLHKTVGPIWQPWVAQEGDLYTTTAIPAHKRRRGQQMEEEVDESDEEGLTGVGTLQTRLTAAIQREESLQSSLSKAEQRHASETMQLEQRIEFLESERRFLIRAEKRARELAGTVAKLMVGQAQDDKERGRYAQG